MKVDQNYIPLSFVKISQPIGSFYICSMTWNELSDISFADIREINEASEKPNEIDDYLGIQRKVSKARIKEISQYVSNLDATFPTSIILHIRSQSLYFDGKLIEEYDDEFIEQNSDKIVTYDNVIVDNTKRKIHIRRDNKIAKILDGQHRIEGFRQAIDEGREIEEFDFNVTIFVDLDLDDQAQIFSVINKAQTKVNKSLVYDLYEYAKTPSPQKTAHDIIRLLNKKGESPFYKKVKILGTARDKENETIAQATLAELIIDSISKDPMADRNSLKKKSLFGKGGLELESDRKELQRRIFRNLFINKKEEVIYQIINNYFSAIAEKWNRAWTNDPPIDKNIISKSNGIIAFFRFLRFVYNDLGKNSELVSKEVFKAVLDKIDFKDTQFTTDIYKPGSSGQSQLYRDLVERYRNVKND
ncbi:MAG: DGQHR domain-containing protein [Arenibacter sp.]